MYDLGDDRVLWPQLQHGPDPRLRSYLINHLQQFLYSPARLAEQLDPDHDSGVRQAIVLILGSTLSVNPAIEHRDALAKSLIRIYKEDPDSGVHSAVEWSLRRLGAGDMIELALTDLSTLGLRQGYHWYVTNSRITMAIFEARGSVQFGSPDSETGRDTRDEEIWRANLDWSFAVSYTHLDVYKRQGYASLPK